MRKVFKYIVIILLLGSCIPLLNAQDGIVVRGKVEDKATGETIIGCNVIEYDQDKRVITGTITDPNGNYILSARDPNAIIMFSFIGYKAQEIPLNSRTVLNVELEAESYDIEAITVVAESDFDPLTNVSQRDVTSSRVKIEMTDSKHIGYISAEEALQGKVAGLDIVSSGDPGSGSSIVIRGLGSLGNSQPLIVIDGIPQNVRVSNSFDFGAADREDIGNLVNIAPQDIKSIEVLKDASSAAVWGSGGADGVLLIETMRGKKGKTQFDYQGKYTWNIQPPPIPLLNGDEYSIMQLEMWNNALGVFEVPSEIAYDPDYIDFYNYSANTDWIDAITQDGFINEQYFKVSGGGEKTGYFASVNLHQNTGTTINTGLDRFTTRVNLDYNVSRKLRFSVNFSYANSQRQNNYVFDPWNNPLNIRQMAYMKAPNMSIWEHDWQGNLTGEYFTPIMSYQGPGTRWSNPVAVGNLSKNDWNESSAKNDLILNWNVFTWMRFQQTVSFTYTDRKWNQFLPYNAVGANWLDYRNNFSFEQNASSNNLITRSQLYFVPRLDGDHYISGMVMFETDQSEGNWGNLQGQNGPSTIIQDPASNPPINWIGSGSWQSRLVGLLGSLNYKFKDRYILAMNLRTDGDSRFGRNRRWGLFPSLSAGWRFSDEPWIQDLSFISDGKLRASWGQAGKQPQGAYDRHAIYNSVIPNQYVEGNIIVPTQIQLANLKWQTVTSSNVGLDLALFNNRFNFTAEIYNKITGDLLWRNYEIPFSSGYSSLKWYNGGKLENKGWELFMQSFVVRRQDFNLSLDFNISQNVNTFLEFPENFNNEVATNIGNGQYPRRAEIGQPIGSFYGFRYLGVWPSDEDVVVTDAEGNIKTDANGNPLPLSYKGVYKFKGGDARYQDVNHDGNIDILDVVYLGDSNPDFTGGFGGAAGWKNFRLSFQFHYRLGFQIVNEIALNTEGMTNKNNQSTAVLHRWRQQGQNEPGMLPRAYMGHPANNLGSDRYVEDGDYLRLVNMTFSYGVPPVICRKIRLKTLDFAFTMRRTITLTRYTGQDPEISTTVIDPFWFGTDRARTPPARAYTLSMALGF